MKHTIPRSVFYYVVLATTFLSGTASGNGCINCHSNPDFYVQDRKLYTYYQDYITSPHKAAGLTCDFCHGGDPAAAGKDIAHQSILKITDPASKLYYRNLPETCGSCHSDKLAQFKQSKHFNALMHEESAPSCTTCHSAMRPRPHYRDIVKQSCRTCHFGENPRNLPLVADRADEFLHRLSIAKVYLAWTSVFYKEQGWPLNSQQEIDDISRKYDEAVTRVHRFDLVTMDESSAEILAELEAAFKKAWDDRPTAE
jgi:formate-dependent nitrite reductase cytochrome c552 subunit